MRPTRSPTPRPALHLSQRNIQARTLVCRDRPAGYLAITLRELLRELVRAAGRRSVGRLESPAAAGAAPTGLAPLRRVLLADEVSRALFAEFTAHRSSDRGGEETGWALLGLRRADEAVALATLPAGTARDADEAHVKFNSAAQAFASRVVRQGHKQLALLGVVHTHPGSLRHPSTGDFRGDIEWVTNLRGGDGVFGIGTADAEPRTDAGISWQPAPNVQCFGDLCLSWYVLGKRDRNYRPLPVGLTIGPDLAAPLRPVWDELEAHAERLDRLARQLSRVKFDVAAGREKAALTLTVPLPEDGRSVRVELEGKDVRYRLLTPDGALAADLREDRVDVGVFLMLSELAAR
jgi:Prokaryotic homologs of the JAB domain